MSKLDCRIIKNLIKQITILNSVKCDETPKLQLLAVDSLFLFIYDYGDKIFIKSDTFPQICYDKCFELENKLRTDIKFNTYDIKEETNKVITTINNVSYLIEKMYPNKIVINKKPDEDDDIISNNSYSGIEHNIKFVSDDDSNDDNDSSSDYVLDELEDKKRVNMDNIYDENYSYYVDKSDDEQDTNTGTPYKLNKKIIKSYNQRRNKKRQNKKKYGNKNDDFPVWIMNFPHNVMDFVEPPKNIKENLTSIYGQINEQNMTKFIQEQIALNNKNFINIENFNKEYENEECKIWEFIDKQGNKSYIFYDLIFGEWNALKMCNKQDKKKLKKYDKLLIQPYNKYTIWRGSNPYNMLDIITPAQ